MKKQLAVLASILTLFGSDTYASRNRRANSIRSRGTQNVNVTGTTTTVNVSIADTIASKTAYTSIAPITDKQAERECTKMIVNALKKQCTGTNKCKNATETYAILEFDDAKLEGGTSDIPSAYRTTYCANFIETAVNKLWNSYDSVANLNEQNCNMALARSLAAEACYRNILATKNQGGALEDRDTNACNTNAVRNYYKQLAGLTTTEEEKLIPSSLNGDDLTKIFSSVGKMSNWNWTALAGKFADLDFSENTTSEYPRELVQLVNSLKSTGNVMCGPDRYTELYDTNFALVDKTSSLEKAIKEKGILKGAADYITDQVSVFTGTNSTNEYKKDGMVKSIVKPIQNKWGPKTTACESEYESQYTVEERSSHTEKFKETWMTTCINEKEAEEKAKKEEEKAKKKGENANKNPPSEN